VYIVIKSMSYVLVAFDDCAGSYYSFNVNINLKIPNIENGCKV